MSPLEKYVNKYLSTELQSVTKRNYSRTYISVFEETIIYKYTEDGYEDVNELLRKSRGQKNSKFGKLLKKSLLKLPKHSGLVYRGVAMTMTEFLRYKKYLASGKPLKEYSFVSTSKLRHTAMAFGATHLFRIWSKSGRSVEEYAKFGIRNFQNEFEVLFVNNSRFNVTEIRKESGYTLITMFEI